VNLALTHRATAQLIGSSRETVTHILREFKELQLIDLNRFTPVLKNKLALVGEMIPVQPRRRDFAQPGTKALGKPNVTSHSLFRNKSIFKMGKRRARPVLLTSPP
jgi:hypothetical protein